MIEELHAERRATCRNCGHPITLMSGDLTGVRWYHDHGTRHCTLAPLAEPDESQGERCAWTWPHRPHGWRSGSCDGTPPAPSLPGEPPGGQDR